MNSRGILTYAVGNPKYIERAKSLARSLSLHDPSLKRAIITDSTDRELGELFTYRIQPRPIYGPARRQKLFLDRYTPFDETLFLDCASLALNNLDAFWTAFEAVPFGTCGARVLRRGDAYSDVDLAFVLDRFHLANIPAVSGAAYCFRRGAAATALFHTARELAQRPSDMRFATHPAYELDGAPADGAVFSVAMAMHGLTGTNMGMGGLCTASDSITHLKLDVSAGFCSLVHRGVKLTPDVLHVANFVESLPYLRECSRLERKAHGRPDLTRGGMLQLFATAGALWSRRKLKGGFRRILKVFPTIPFPQSLPSHQ